MPRKKSRTAIGPDDEVGGEVEVEVARELAARDAALERAHRAAGGGCCSTGSSISPSSGLCARSAARLG